MISKTPALGWSCLTRSPIQLHHAVTAPSSPLIHLLRRSLSSSIQQHRSLISSQQRFQSIIHGQTIRPFSIKSLWPSNSPIKQLDNLADQADDAPTSIDASLKFYSTYIALPAAAKSTSDVAKRIIERYEMQTKLWTSSTPTSGSKESTLLQSNQAWDAYLTALTNWSHPNIPTAGERVASASQRRDAVLAGTAESLSATLPANPASPSNTLTDEQLVSAVMSDKSGSGSNVRVVDSPNANPTTTSAGAAAAGTGYRGFSSSSGSSGSSGDNAGNAARKNEPIRVIVEEARGSLVLKMIRFLLTVAIYAFVSLTLLSLILDSSGLMRAGTSRAPGSLEVQTPGTGKKVTFNDVHGCEEAKAELAEVVDFLQNPQKFAKLGGKLPKGVLLTGPPGTGKTLLARAVAGEAGVSFLFASGSEFDELFVGVGAKRVRELFAAARKAAPCIIFIDELDAIGSKRSPRDAQHMRQTLNQLLTELDGFNQSEGVILLGATNLPNLLDKALTRPGRFDRHVAVPLPDVRGRLKILEHHVKVTRVSPGMDMTSLARGTPGFSGAQLENLVNQAAVKASGEGSTLVELRHFDWAKDRILMGAERLSAVVTPESKRKTAFHEAGHALVALYTEGAMPLYHVTVMPRGHSLGHTMQLPDMDRDSESYKELRARLDVAMGGRVAEELIYGKENITSGAQSDIKSATNVAQLMCREYGFSDALGVVNLAEDEKLSATTLATIEGEVKTFISEAQNRAKDLLQTRSVELNRLAEALVEYESLTLPEVQKVIKGERLNRTL